MMTTKRTPLLLLVVAVGIAATAVWVLYQFRYFERELASLRYANETIAWKKTRWEQAMERSLMTFAGMWTHNNKVAVGGSGLTEEDLKKFGCDLFRFIETPSATSKLFADVRYGKDSHGLDYADVYVSREDGHGGCWAFRIRRTELHSITIVPSI